MEKIEEIPTHVLTNSNESGIMSEQQLRGILLGYYARTLKTRDRRGTAMAIGELPQGAVEYTEDGMVSIAGEKVMANAPINVATGLPESAGALLPNHRAVMGWELALSMIIPPEDFIAAVIYTDDLPQNVGKTDAEKEWVALTYKPKFKQGPSGKALAHHKCGNCGEEWEAELHAAGKCIKCYAGGFMNRNGMRVPIVDRRILDGWSDEEVFAIKENARILKRIVHQLAGQGFFTTKPRIDERPNELGTDELVHGEDDMTMGFQITAKGLGYAEAFGKKNPFLLHGHHILDAMGASQAKNAPEWLKAAQRTGEAPVTQTSEAAPPPIRVRTPIDPKKLKAKKPKLSTLKKKPANSTGGTLGKSKTKKAPAKPAKKTKRGKKS